MAFRFSCLLAPCIALALVGCGGPGDNITLYDLNGTVTFDGKPVAHGTIQFRPDTSQKNEGPMGTAMIVDGKYDTAAEGGKGVVGGPYIILITGYDQKPVGDVEDETAETPDAPKPIFTNVQLEEELPKETTMKDFVIPGGA